MDRYEKELERRERKEMALAVLAFVCTEVVVFGGLILLLRLMGG